MKVVLKDRREFRRGNEMKNKDSCMIILNIFIISGHSRLNCVFFSGNYSGQHPD